MKNLKVAKTLAVVTHTHTHTPMFLGTPVSRDTYQKHQMQEYARIFLAFFLWL